MPPIEHHDARDRNFSSRASPVPQSLAITPTISETLRPLFDYFVHRMTVSISRHRGIQDEICSSIVPVAMQVPYLLFAVLALAAAHRQSSGLVQGDCQFELMKGKSPKQLRSSLDQFSPSDNDQVLATTLILCMVEVISLTPSTSSWRSHLYGAATLSAYHSTCAGSSGSSSSAFLRRKHQTLQAIALACGSKSYEGRILINPSHENAHIDDLAGFSTNLLPILKDTNDLERLHKDHGSKLHCDAPPGPLHFDCNSLMEHQSHLLFDRIRVLMGKRKMSRMKGDLSWAIYQDLYLWMKRTTIWPFFRSSDVDPYPFLYGS